MLKVIAEDFIQPEHIKTVHEQEAHDYNEGLLVICGCLHLDVAGQTVKVQSGEMYLVEAGVAHSVLAGSHGTLMIVDV